MIHQGRVLLVQRGQEPLRGEWSLPGGALELGETLEAGVSREVWEETGLRVKPVKIVETLDRIVRDAGGVRYHYVLIDFLCEWTGGELACGSDACDARWLRREELNSHSIYRIAPFTIDVIEKAFTMAGRPGQNPRMGSAPRSRGET